MKLGFCTSDRYVCCLCQWEGTPGLKAKKAARPDSVLLDHLRITHHRVLIHKTEVMKKGVLVRMEFHGPFHKSSEELIG